MNDSIAIADQAERGRLTDSLRGLVGDAELLLKSAQRNGSEQFVAARDKFETQLQRARTELDALTDTAGYNVRRAARATDSAVHHHPYAAMGVAVGVGVLLGALVARR